MKNRLDSLDVLRGFDMFFITGGAGLVAGIFAALGCCPFMVSQMQHVPWQGLAHHDTIFPLFLFLSGVSWPFSYSSQVAHGKTQWQIHSKLLVRVVTLFLLGLSFGGFLAFNPNFRLMSVLGFIGISWGIAAILYIHIKKNLWRLVTLVVLLAGYWALLRFFHAPDAPADILAGALGSYAKETNIVTWFDRVCFTNHLMVKVGKGFLYEPESLFSVTNGAALALMGMLAGTILRNEKLDPMKKAASLFGCAFICLAFDCLFIFLLGDVIVKALWTTSFVLSSAVYSFLMLAVFYFVIDVKGCSKWGVLFRCIGRNSILIYLMNLTGVTASISRWIFRGVRAHSGDWQQAVTGLTFFIAAWAVLYYLDRKKIYLKV